MSAYKLMNVRTKVSGTQGIHLSRGRVGFFLLHGLGGTPVELRFLAQGLNRAGYSVCCPMLAGHGGTDILLSATTWRDWLASAQEAFDTFRAECDHVIVGGLSAGSVLSLHLAASRKSDIAGLTLFSPTFWPNGWAIPWYTILFRLIRHKTFANLFNSKVKAPFGIKDERIRRFVLESLQSEGRPLQDIFGRRGGTVWEYKAMTSAAKPLLGEISQPVLICHSREDDQSDLSNAYLLQRKLAGSVELLVLDDCFHMITLDRQRAQVLERTLAFADHLVLPDAQSLQTAHAAAGPAGAVASVLPGPRSA